VRPYLEKIFHKKGLVELLKANPSTQKKEIKNKMLKAGPGGTYL
jgi:hypothetical protein